MVIGLSSFRQKKPDLIITNIFHTGLDGNELVGIFKETDSFIPVIVNTSYRNSLKTQPDRIFRRIFSLQEFAQALLEICPVLKENIKPDSEIYKSLSVGK
jgi:CheY-like chemotaxis protein